MNTRARAPAPSQLQPSQSRPPSNPPNIRRNLFHSTLSRRPDRTASASTSTSATTLHDGPLSPVEKDACGGEIVVRDRDGNYSLGFEVPPIMDGEEDGEDEGDGGEGEGEVGREKLEERLLEMLRNKNHNVGDPAELHAAIRSSLRRKVESLEEDNWMFEAESGKGE